MGHPLAELRNILAKKENTQGTVVSVGVSTVSVATPSGLVEMAKPSGVACKSGDTVSLSGGGIRSVRASNPSTPVFLV